MAERKKGILLSLQARVEERVSAKFGHLREFQGGPPELTHSSRLPGIILPVSSFKEISFTLS